jgi:hypothetical protein
MGFEFVQGPHLRMQNPGGFNPGLTPRICYVKGGGVNPGLGLGFSALRFGLRGQSKLT